MDAATDDRPYRIALIYPDDRGSRFLPLLRDFGHLGVQAEPLAHHDDSSDEVRRRLLDVDGALVWVNPIQDGRSRAALDAVLREAAAAGVFVSAHPDVIAKLGTKEVLHATRDIGWGSDVHLYRDVARMRRELPDRLAGGPRVLKRLRGNGGIGVWKVELDSRASGVRDIALRVRHAQRGSVEESTTLEEFCRRCEVYVAADGGMLDQAWQPRLSEGMVRCYLVHDRVEGFGHQADNALLPATSPGPRLYHPPTLPRFQPLRRKLEREWVPALQRRFGLDAAHLPVLWDCDFLLGPKSTSGADTYVLCEINASSVSPFPDSAVAPVARAALERMREAREKRGR